MFKSFHFQTGKKRKGHDGSFWNGRQAKTIEKAFDKGAVSERQAKSRKETVYFTASTKKETNLTERPEKGKS